MTAPALVLWSRQDGVVPMAYCERCHDRVAGARLEVIGGCGHGPRMERPAELADAVLPG